jgi:hypothetical protein
VSLNFQFAEGIDRKLIEYTQEDGSLHWTARAQSFVYYQMALQHDICGEMTDDKLIEIARRIAQIDMMCEYPHYWERDGDIQKGYRHSLADVVTYWGLTTNVSHKTRTQWDAYFNKCWTNAKANKRLLRDVQETIKRLSVRKHISTHKDADRS